VKGLSLSVKGGINSEATINNFYQSKKFFNNPNGIARISKTNYTSRLEKNLLRYKTAINGAHHISVLLGTSYQDFKTTSLGGGGHLF
jgi:hypothetical protein